MRKNTEADFWPKVSQAGDCWNWTEGKTGKGYGNFSMAGRSLTAHRFAYESLVGPVPDGLELDHLCRNRACVNPYHLDPVPHAVNVRRGVSGIVNGGRQARKTHCPQNHQYTPGNTYVNPNTGGRLCRSCQRSWQKAFRANRKD